MPEIANALELADAIRVIQRRRQFDDAGVRLSLELAQRGTVWVAHDQGEPIGIVVAHDSEEERYVGDLFVEPSYRGQGLGAGLLDAALSDAGDLAQTMLFDPGDAAAFALALRQRMAQRESLVRFAGAIPREEELAKMAAGEYRFQVDVVDPLAHSIGLNGLDRQSRGAVRPSDHTEFARSATGHCFFLSGELVGYAYVWPDGRLGPLACASEAYLVQIFAYALVTLQRRYGASWCSALIPGSNRRIARAALRAGLRIQTTSLLASDALELSLSTYIGYHELLF